MCENVKFDMRQSRRVYDVGTHPQDDLNAVDSVARRTQMFLEREYGVVSTAFFRLKLNRRNRVFFCVVAILR